jgi:starch-binding outer membrane protein, SusD/RagB family
MKNVFKLVALALLIIGAGSCQKDKLNPTSPVFVLDNLAFSTPARINSQVFGLYDACKSGAFLGCRMAAFSDIRGEEFINRTQNAVTGLTTWNQSFFNGTNEVNYFWQTGYAVINQCNNFIDGLNANAKVLNDAKLQAQYEAEARFVRALAYSYLVTLYCRPYAEANGVSRGLPLRLNAEKDLNNNDLAPTNVAGIYAQILKDLDFAEANLGLISTSNVTPTPAASVTTLLNTTRAHRNTAIALKTRIYLAMQRWSDVITEANKIVSTAAPFKSTTGVAHNLMPDIAVTFATPYTSAESIFSFPFSDVDQPGTQNSIALYWAAAPIGNGEYNLNLTTGVGIAVDTPSFRVADSRRKFISKTGTLTYLNGKFATGPINIDYMPILRYAEVLLNLAEATTRSSTTIDARAIALLNAVRQRSDPGVTFAAADFATTDALRNAIWKERRIEFLGEGFRSFDITRNLLPFPAKTGAASVAVTSASYVYPIPASEIAINKLMTP